MAGAIEQKAAAAPSAALVAGYLSGLAIQVFPWLRDNLTPDQKQALPVVIAFLLSAAAAYLAPHTHRPDLTPVAPPPSVTSTPPAA
jgi:hypothetical protein